MRPPFRALILSAALAQAGGAWAIAGDGLKAREDEPAWAQWQGRLSLGTTAPFWRANLLEAEPVGLRINAVTVSGDYYFTGSLFDRADVGGLRATSGLIVGPRTQAMTAQPTLGARGSGFSVERRLFGPTASTAIIDATPDLSSLPYFGLGYTGLSARRNWSFSADLGLVALYPGNVVRLGKVFGGTQSLDDMLRDMRLAPMLQMGVSYSF